MTKIFIAISIVLGMIVLCSSVSSAQMASPIDFKGNPIGSKVISFDRKNIIGDIYEYNFVLKVGPGEFDKIGIHRVTRERGTARPVPSSAAVMMVHGDTSDFNSAFLMSTLSDKVPKNQSLGMFLAENGIDVWGIDLRWTRVKDCSDGCDFMARWNSKTNLADLKIAVKFARVVRGLTGSQAGKVFLLGHSSGARYCYDYAGTETQIPDLIRDIKGIIPMDMAYKLDPSESDLIENATNRYYVLKALRDSGRFYNDDAITLKYIAALADTDPNNMSLVIPGLTNKQAAMFALSATYYTYPYTMTPPVPFYHYCAGTFDDNYSPISILFTRFNYMIDFAAAVPGYEAINDYIDNEALWADFDNSSTPNIAAVKVPVLYIGAAGGIGRYGIYSLSLLGSRDKTITVISFNPPEYEGLDYGHIDLLYADNARSLVWKPIGAWIKSR